MWFPFPFHNLTDTHTERDTDTHPHTHLINAPAKKCPKPCIPPRHRGPAPPAAVAGRAHGPPGSPRRPVVFLGGGRGGVFCVFFCGFVLFFGGGGRGLGLRMYVFGIYVCYVCVRGVVFRRRQPIPPQAKTRPQTHVTGTHHFQPRAHILRHRQQHPRHRHPIIPPTPPPSLHTAAAAHAAAAACS